MDNFFREKNDILDAACEAYELFSSGEEACKTQMKQTEVLIDKLNTKSITLSVIGQFKRGKSTLSNCILGKSFMPVGIVPITSAVTKVVYGDEDAKVYFENGEIKPVAIKQLSEYISEQKNSNNELGVKEVVIQTKSDFLSKGICYVDTPGVGSFHKNNTDVAYDYMKESDAVIFLLSVDSPINQIEIDFLQSAGEYAGKFYFVVNKTDTVSKDDLDAYLSYCESLLSKIMKSDEIKLIPVSAKTGAGVDNLKNMILVDCKRSIREIMQESTRKKLTDIIAYAMKELNFYWKAMTMSYEDLDDQFAALREYIDEQRATATETQSMFEVKLNELKLGLSKKILELFNMEYSFEIEELGIDSFVMEKEEYLKKVDGICENIQSVLSSVLLYREENAYVVIRRIENINRITRRLRSLKNRVENIKLDY